MSIIESNVSLWCFNPTEHDSFPNKYLSISYFIQTPIDTELVCVCRDYRVAREYTQSTANDTSGRVCVCVCACACVCVTVYTCNILLCGYPSTCGSDVNTVDGPSTSPGEIQNPFCSKPVRTRLPITHRYLHKQFTKTLKPY